MAVPTLLQVFPADGDTGIPVGEELTLIFDRGVDMSTIPSSVVLYGRDFDRTSGPDSAYWVDPETSDNPYYLKSPGFTGTVEVTFDAVYVDLSDYSEVTPGAISSEADETGADIGHKVIIRPSSPLAPEVEYTLHVTGDPDDVGVGVSSRTVFDSIPDAGNAGSTGQVYVFGGYKGAFAETLNIRITDTGDIGTAKYKWWYAGDGEPSAKIGNLTSRRYRTVQDGLEIRFTGSDFRAGDLYTIALEPIERLAESTKVVFTTNDGSYSEAPESPSTPAPSAPPATVGIPGVGAAIGAQLYLVEMSPEDGSYNNSTKTRSFTMVFDDALDPATITDDTVRLYLHDIDGHYGCTSEPKELEKTLSIDGNILTIEI